MTERFMSKVEKAEGGCWLWTAAVNERGYGYFYADGRMGLAHRSAYRLLVGPFAPELRVLHRCDTPACVNPAHLFLGTDRDNRLDCKAKRRDAQAGTGASPFVGVSPHRGRWRGLIHVRGHRTSLGIFDTETEAAEAYDTFVLAHDLGYPLNRDLACST